MGARDGRGGSTGGSGDGSEHEPAPPPIPPRSHRSTPSSIASQPTSPKQSTSGIPILSVQTDPARSQQPASTLEKKPTGGALRININPGTAGTIRAVTPEPVDPRTGTYDSPGSRTGGMRETGGSHTTASPLPRPSRGAPPVSLQSSPRSKSTSSNGSGGGRRQGRVFTDNVSDPASGASPATSPPGRQAAFRPRTHTLDGASVFRQQISHAPERQRVASVSSGVPMSVSTENLRSPPLMRPGPNASDSMIYHTNNASPTLSPEPQIPIPAKSAGRRLVKRTTSRPTSPLVSPPPSVDSLPLPIPTANANNVLLLMRNLCGRMRGEIEYRGEDVEGPWYSGIGYIEEEKGSLMFDSGDNGPFHIAIVPDLRGCRILPVERPDRDGPCLEVTNILAGSDITIRPFAPEEFDLWLAALLSWQQLRPGSVKPPSIRNSTTPTQERPEYKRRTSSHRSKDGAIIKVGKVNLWDKGTANTPRGIVKRPSTRDLQSSQTMWRRVSCILQDNGEFKLMTENDVTILSVIELPQLSRCAVQQLDRSVLDEDFCLAIFPIYSSTSTQLSIFRPVYLALDSRVLFEVWYVLLRTFMVPDIYALDPLDPRQVLEITDLETEYEGTEVFRIEKTISLKVTEAKLKPKIVESPPPPPQERYEKHERHEKHEKHDRNDKCIKSEPTDLMVGNYLAEVILDGEVRARTTTKTDTNNPFWRDDCEFADLPAALPYLSVVLKRQDGNLDSAGHQLQASLGMAKTGNILEVMCGSVDIPLTNLVPGKDHEEWFQIYDSQQQSIGSLFAKVHHEELAVLRAREYNPLSDLLHNFSSGLTVQISSALPGNLRRLAEIFLNIFQVSGTTSEWLMTLVEDEIDGIGNQGSMKKFRFGRRLKSNESFESASDREQLVRDMSKSLAGEANLLFRGNSLLTQALEFHMRRLGNEFLIEVLREKIFEINEINANCEVDPGKLQPGEDLQTHWRQLIQYTTEIWECIATSTSKFPSELRQILKYVRAVAEDRYGDFLRTVSYTSVSGFLFLRFICPAILNPKLNGLLRDLPRPRAQRTLTLIAKGLQAMANLSTIGRKETWLEPMNKFIASHRQSVKDFIDSICSVPAERSNPILPPSYSTPNTIASRLPTTAREGLPSLPYLIDMPRNFAALIKLWTEARRSSSAGSPPRGNAGNSRSEDLEGELLRFDQECSALSKRSDECSARVDGLRLAETASHADDPYLDAAMEYVHLSNSPGPAHVAMWADHDAPPVRPPGSSGSDGHPGDGLLLGGSRSASRDRWGRQISYGSDVSSTALGSASSGGQSLTSLGHNTIRGLRNGRQARKFLSGLIKKSRTTSPDAGGKDRDAKDQRHHSNQYHQQYKEKPDRGRDGHRDRDYERIRNGIRDTSASSKTSRNFGF
ncbi:uncharacterized protein PgNI_03475 [Pyricularia grisea]|uniref:Ras-GAP domain-containing protein n=1 Tax=Pyricularia grisea TaxID=148305 RepID=A0A6P8BA98_PYRGI|nr:uncharacterized protein PgNI_03475 [Pyricularia grisea]TLD12751.1 hypothetical protein PgNI_03475 [Pyricularia grisea]